MKYVYFYCFISLIPINAFSWYGGSEYMPSYEGRAGAGYITPSRFAPIGYTKNTGWDSSDESCYQTVSENRRTSSARVVPAQTRVRIIQK